MAAFDWTPGVCGRGSSGTLTKILYTAVHLHLREAELTDLNTGASRFSAN